MTRAIAVELIKFRTTRAMWGLLGGMAVLVALSEAVSIGTVDSAQLASEDGLRAAMHSASSGVVFVLVAGILATAGEYRHSTINQTFLSTPVRSRAILAKLVAYVLVGLAGGVVASFLTLAIGLPWLAAKDAPAALTDRDVWLTLLGTIAACGFYGAVGVAVGALIRSPMAAVAAALAWLLIAEELIFTISSEAGRWLPGAAGRALARAPDAGLLAMGAGAAVFLVWVGVLAVAAVRQTERLDVP